MTTVLLARKVGADDILFGRSSVSYIAPDGSVRSVPPVNASHIPFNSADGTVEKLVDGSCSLDIQVKSITVSRTINYATDTGVVNAYAISIPGISSYVPGQHFFFKALNTNTDSSTLNVNSLGAVAIKCYRNGGLQSLVANDIRAGQIIEVIYDGTQFIMLNPPANALDATTDLVTPDEIQNQIYEYWWNESLTDSYVINPDPPVTSYYDGQRWCIYTQVGNTGACSLSVSNLPAVPIKRKLPDGTLSDLSAGDILPNEVFEVVYVLDIDCFLLVGGRLPEFGVGSYFYTQHTGINPASILHYGTWTALSRPYMGLYHFDGNLDHHDYHYYNRGLLTYTGSGSGPSYSSVIRKFGQSLVVATTDSYTVYSARTPHLEYGFMVDVWLYYSSTTSLVFYLWGTSTTGVALSIDSNRLRVREDGTIKIDLAAPSVNTWHHIAMGVWREGGAFYARVWVNGAVQATAVLSAPILFNGISAKVLQRLDTSGVNVYVDELRFVDRVLYGDTYTVPTSPYTPIGPGPVLWTRTA